MIDALIELAVGAMAQGEIVDKTYICSPAAAAGFETNSDPFRVVQYDVRGVTYVFRPLDEDEAHDFFFDDPVARAEHDYGFFELGEERPTLLCRSNLLFLSCGRGVSSARVDRLIGRFAFVQASYYVSDFESIEGVDGTPKMVIGTCSEL